MPWYLILCASLVAADDPSREIDRLLAEAQRVEGVQPAPICDDATFLRRISLDLIGRIPTIDELDAFLAEAIGALDRDMGSRAVARSFGAHFEKEPPAEDGNYLVAHTTFGYLIDTEGKVSKLFQAGAPPEDIASAAKALLRSGS